MHGEVMLWAHGDHTVLEVPCGCEEDLDIRRAWARRRVFVVPLLVFARREERGVIGTRKSNRLRNLFGSLANCVNI